MSGLFRTLNGEAGQLRVYSTAESGVGVGSGAVGSGGSAVGSGSVAGGGGPGSGSGSGAGPGVSNGPVLVLCHDLPRVKGGGSDVGRTFPSLADRLASESGWRAVTPTLRGAGGSAGDFSAAGWLRDLGTVMAEEVGADERALLVGFGLGGAVALRHAVDDERVRGVALLGTADDLSGWAGRPDGLLERCRESGVITDPEFPADPTAWAAELADLRPVEMAAELGSRSMLVVHGVDDADVPVSSARALAEAARGPVDLRIVPGAGHWLRADPRVVATLVGWIERQH